MNISQQELMSVKQMRPSTRWKFILNKKKTEACQEILNIDIENINKIGNIHKNHKTPLRKIYEVIQQEFFEENDILPKEFLKQ